jgi:hypothetical protein
MKLTIVVEHVFVGFLGPMDETTIKINMSQIINIEKSRVSIYLKALNGGKLTLSDGKFKRK